MNLLVILLIGGMFLIYMRIFGYFNKTKYKNHLLIAGIVMTFLGVTLLFANDSSGGHRCAICGTTKDLRQITAKTSSGEWDPDWYCAEHYADAWQYYYGNN